jgi:alanine racemase
MAIVPIGYWHGFPRSLSSIGDMLIRGERARVLGRVSMDLVALLLANGEKVKSGDRVTIIGKDGSDEIFTWDIAQKSGTNSYEFSTRLNPLMERIVVHGARRLNGKL